jgi:hypothetical protein
MAIEHINNNDLEIFALKDYQEVEV